MGNMSGSYGSHYTLRQTITVNSQNIANNTSNVTVRMYLSFDGSTYWATQYDPTYGKMHVNRYLDGKFYTVWDASISEIVFASGQAKDILLASWTDDVPHGDAGEKTLEVKGEWNTNTDRIGSGTCSASLVLPTIPRSATVTSVSNFEHGSNASVNISNPSR